jgi:hypothetical protein
VQTFSRAGYGQASRQDRAQAGNHSGKRGSSFVADGRARRARAEQAGRGRTQEQGSFRRRRHKRRVRCMVSSACAIRTQRHERHSRCHVAHEDTGGRGSCGGGGGGIAPPGPGSRRRERRDGREVTVRHAGRAGIGSSLVGCGASSGCESSVAGAGIGGHAAFSGRQSGSNSPPGPYLLFIVSRQPISLEGGSARASGAAAEDTHYCRARFSSRSLPTSPSSMRTSAARALLNSSRY